MIIIGSRESCIRENEQAEHDDHHQMMMETNEWRFIIISLSWNDENFAPFFILLTGARRTWWSRRLQPLPPPTRNLLHSTWRNIHGPNTESTFWHDDLMMCCIGVAKGRMYDLASSQFPELSSVPPSPSSCPLRHLIIHPAIVGFGRTRNGITFFIQAAEQNEEWKKWWGKKGELMIHAFHEQNTYYITHSRHGWMKGQIEWRWRIFNH